eukprot:jgi/Psemu1/17378/gm1.17378_g
MTEIDLGALEIKFKFIGNPPYNAALNQCYSIIAHDDDCGNLFMYNDNGTIIFAFNPLHYIREGILKTNTRHFQYTNERSKNHIVQLISNRTFTSVNGNAQKKPIGGKPALDKPAKQAITTSPNNPLMLLEVDIGHWQSKKIFHTDLSQRDKQVPQGSTPTNLVPIQPVDFKVDVSTHHDAPSYTWNWTYFPSSDLVSFR